MFTPARFIVIDNERTHMEAVTNALQALGTPCVGIHYDPAKSLDKAHFQGVRVLLLDLHLLSGVKQTDDKSHFSLIATILEDNIHEDGGPFIVVLWTQNPQKAPELLQYLEANLKAHSRPLTIIALDKASYIALPTGAVNNQQSLKCALEAQVLANPQISAILSWEAEVHSATARTLASLLRLIPDDKKTSASFSGELDSILSILATAAVGVDNVGKNVRGAINSVLAPIISDRLHAMSGSGSAAIWGKAVTRYQQKANLAPAAAAAINQMLHVEGSGAVPISWGAVLEVPAAWREAGKFEERFGVPYEKVCTEEFRIKAANIASCEPVLVRIGAACDYAQRKMGPIPYILGFEIPLAAIGGSSAPQSLWKSPHLVREGKVYALLVSCALIVTLPESVATSLKVLYRIREQLLMELINKVSTHLARPGKISV